MNRRDVLKTGLAAGIAGTADINASAAEANHFYELRTYQLRNDIQPAKINDFFQGHFLPRLQKLGVGPVGCFNVVAGQLTPALIVLVDYKSLAEMQATMAASNDKEFLTAWRNFETAADMPYVRYESVLLKAFDAHPKVELPASADKQADKQPARLFELRTYESRNAFTLRNKVDMFNQEEIKIFRACGIQPVFFGEGVIGTRMPSLTYMVGYENMAARDKAWDTFRAILIGRASKPNPAGRIPKPCRTFTLRFCAQPGIRKSGERRPKLALINQKSTTNKHKWPRMCGGD